VAKPLAREVSKPKATRSPQPVDNNAKAAGSPDIGTVAAFLPAAVRGGAAESGARPSGTKEGTGMKSTTGWFLACAMAGFVAGCGSRLPPPNDEWAAGQADIGRAQAVGALYDPEARLHLQLAQEDLEKSKHVMGDDNRRAASLAALASTEAQLAFSLARQAAAQDRALKTRADLQKAQGSPRP
jgi:hypothetical protein